MMESVLLLIGFSGDDPNFLSWSGWVRDNLGDASPKIYLAGWLNLSPQRRRVLQNRGVNPIDLAYHPQALEWPKGNEHQQATKWLISALEGARPYDRSDWPMAPNNVAFEINLSRLVEGQSRNTPLREPTPQELHALSPSGEPEQVIQRIWEHNRRLYPGWLVCPTNEKWQLLKSNTDKWEDRILERNAGSDLTNGMFAIRELIWRRAITQELLSDALEFAATDSFKSFDPRSTHKIGASTDTDEDDKQLTTWVEIGLALAANARWKMNRAAFERLCDAIEGVAADRLETKHALHHERCLWAASRLDHAALADQLSNWDGGKRGSDLEIPQSALQVELGPSDAADSLIDSGINSIRVTYTKVDDIEGASRRDGHCFHGSIGTTATKLGSDLTLWPG